MSERWCLASQAIGNGCGDESELGCDRLEHEDNELHYDKVTGIHWLGRDEAANGWAGSDHPFRVGR